MNERIKAMREFFAVEKGQKKYRQERLDPFILAKEFEKEGTDPVERETRRLCRVLEQEKPVVFPDERIAFTRTVTNIPEIFTRAETEKLKEKHWLHEKGEVCNINVNYGLLMNVGFEAKKTQLAALRADFEAKNQTEKAQLISCQLRILDAVQSLADRYRAEAERVGNTTVAKTLANVPAKAPQNLLEALQMFRIIHFTMWCGGNYHNTVGRFDRLMYPYFKKDMDGGIYNKESALELMEEFFLTFNRDSDLYPGIQQGDNGQSLVLGGLDADGNDCFSELSELCMISSLELKLIDPKINLRVHKNTPLEQYILATELTKQGLGFPQYSNDEVVIPGLIRLGYSPEDASDYVVAACWEFIVSGKALDIPNIAAFSFAKPVQEAVYEDMEDCEDFGELKAAVKRRMEAQADELCAALGDLYVFPAPFLSLMTEGACEEGRDISEGSRYNNFGIHGTGLACAADSLAAVKKYVYDEKSISKTELLEALRANFAGHELLQNRLRYDSPKMGNNDDAADDIATELLDLFADSLEGRVNERGGIFRPGTGSAMYYILHSADVPATPDGRNDGENLACNYSPGLMSKCKGPVSIIQSFTKPNLERCINGGPLTLELHDTVFRSSDSVEKTAMLVKSYFDMGGHQLQINAVNRDTMLDAQKHPEKYRNLIVRVWGWSGYFVELDKIYQEHIIKRMELSV